MLPYKIVEQYNQPGNNEIPLKENGDIEEKWSEYFISFPYRNEWDDLIFVIDVSGSMYTCKNNKDIDYKNIIHNDKVAKVSIVGAGMVSTPGITYRMFRALSEEKINILAISTSEIKLSVIIDEDNTLIAIKKLHTIFDLD